MKKVSLFAVFVMLLGMGFVSNVNAITNVSTGYDNSISIQKDFDGGIIDPTDEDEDDKDEDKIRK
jgi:putative salt-induced outer membrane protein YdiY